MSQPLRKQAEQHFKKYFNAQTCVQHRTNHWISINMLEDTVFEVIIQVDGYCGEKPIHPGDAVWQRSANTGQSKPWYVFEVEPDDSREFQKVKCSTMDLKPHLELK